MKTTQQIKEMLQKARDEVDYLESLDYDEYIELQADLFRATTELNLLRVLLK